MFTQTESEKREKRLWMFDNPGKLKEIAGKLNVTYSAVHGVFMYHQKSRDCRIESALACAGAPLMKKLLTARATGGRKIA